VLLDIYGSRSKDHDEHVEILNALRSRDPELCRGLMQKHLDGVRDALVRWDPDLTPIS
jgi:DNA-binding GntR family transcriptional regulator